MPGTGLRPRTLIIPAAGFGTRMRSVDPDLPKEMLPLAGRPVIDYAVAEAADAGIERVVVIIRRGKEIIREHLAAAFPHLDTIILFQAEPRGEMDAISLAAPYTAGEPVAVIHPDNIYLPAPGALRRLAEAYAEHQSDVTGLLPMDRDSAAVVGNSGHVELQEMPGGEELYRIRRLLPKGPGQFELRRPAELRACGLRCLGPHLFTFLEQARPAIAAGEEFTDGPVLDLIVQERSLLGLVLPGRLYDVGNPLGYGRCQQALAPMGQG